MRVAAISSPARGRGWAPRACAAGPSCWRSGPTWRSATLRGNVDTRLRRLAEGDYDALVLAAAGLERLGRAEGEAVPEGEMTPAPGQGCLALEARGGDGRHRRAGGRGSPTATRWWRSPPSARW